MTIQKSDFDTIAALDLDPIKVKLMHRESGEGWSLHQANAIESEYRRFLYLMKKFPNEPAAPRFDVDIFWHYHILDTVKYAQDCHAVFGYFLHHFPYVGLRGEEDLKLHRQVGERMRELYEETFDEPYVRDTELWTAAATAMPQVAGDIRPELGTAATAFSVVVARGSAAAIDTAFSVRSPTSIGGTQTAFSVRAPVAAAATDTAFSVRTPAYQAETQTAFSVRAPAYATGVTQTAFSVRAPAFPATTAFSVRAPASDPVIQSVSSLSAGLSVDEVVNHAVDSAGFAQENIMASFYSMRPRLEMVAVAH
jgi:hypothetical protein